MKFRVWDSVDKKFSPLTLYSDKIGMIGFYFNPSRTYLQQYTGLFDKNEKEICEGDIIKELHYDMNYVLTEHRFNTFVVKFGNHALGTFGGAGIVGAIFYLDPIVTMVGPRAGGLINISEVFRLSVIGNTFENPELLIKEHHIYKNGWTVLKGEEAKDV